MNTTRAQTRNEATGEEAQNYLYMWKHACAFTKWIPSNQFMYANVDYDENTMTLERFGFIGMDKRCFWGSIGVLWKRPLPVEQILPNATITSVAPVPKPKPTPKPTPPPKKEPEEEKYVQPPPDPAVLPEENRVPVERPGKNSFKSILEKGNDVEVNKKDWKTFTINKSKKDAKHQ